VHLAGSFVDPAQTEARLEGFERSRRHQAMVATGSVGVAVGGHICRFCASCGLLVLQRQPVIFEPTVVMAAAGGGLVGAAPV
jgi:hypothetical protein